MPGVPLRLSTRQRDLADARTRFLTDDEIDEIDVRDVILDSWRRSRDLNVHADRVEVPYVGSPDLDTSLVQSAVPLLGQLAETLTGEPVSVVLTDPDGLVLARLIDDVALERHLDRVNLAPGFTYAERDVGTNGIGTALDRQSAFSVIGSEHFAEGLADLACFGTPIRDPLTHDLVGLLDLTCWNRTANPFLAALAAMTATRIEEAILRASGHRELALLQAYEAECRSATWPVIATNDAVTMMNDAARTRLRPDDQTTLLARTAELITSGRPHRFPVEFAESSAQVECTPAWTATGPAGCVITVRFDRPAGIPPARVPSPGASTARGSRTARPLPGLAGSSPAWVRCCDDARRASLAGRPLLLVGEPGVGKLALADAVHRDRSPGVFAQVRDARDAGTRTDWLGSVQAALSARSGPLILRRLDQLPEWIEPDLVSMLQTEATRRRGDTTPWLMATSTTDDGRGPAGLLDLFPARVAVPPLRRRLPDLPDIATTLLSRLHPRSPRRCSSLATNILLRGRWPGNVAELDAALTEAAKRCRSGVLQPADLPARCHATGPRTLTPLESVERDAIVNLLAATNGDKMAAAHGLQVSRATIYRKIRRYGINLIDLEE